MNFEKLMMALCLIALSSISAFGQVMSPVINDDSTVTFSYVAHDVHDVHLCGSFITGGIPVKTPLGTFRIHRKIEMRPENDSIWTYTTKPLDSDLYTYYFLVEKNTTLDPSNCNIMHDGKDSLNYFFVGDGLVDIYRDKRVPHGKVKEVWYDSSLEGLPRRRMLIYLPPEYQTKKKSHFPVLYLLHGSGSDENSWIDIGRLTQIMDNMIAKKSCVPMIVVMPNGNANQAASSQEINIDAPSNDGVGSMVGHVERAFMPDIVQYVEKHYRVIRGKHGRAIAGVSMGGLHTIFISVNNPESFDYVGLFSPQTTTSMMDNSKRNGAKKLAHAIVGVTEAVPFLKKVGLGKKAVNFANVINSGDMEIYENYGEKLDAQFKTPPRLYYVAIGRDDFLKKTADDFLSIFDEAGYQYYYNETKGGHDWVNWRRYLVDFLPRLFKMK